MSCSPSQKNNSLMFSSRHYYLLHNILWLNIYNININIYMQWIKLFFIVWLILKAQLQRLLQTKLTLLTVSFVSVFNFQPHWEISENNMAFDQPTMIGTEIWNILTRNFYWWKKGNHFLDYFWRNTTMQQYTENFQHMVGWCPLLNFLWKITFFRTQTWRTMRIPTCLIRLLSLQVPSPKKLRRLIFIDFIQPLSDKACHKLK